MKRAFLPFSSLEFLLYAHCLEGSFLSFMSIKNKLRIQKMPLECLPLSLAGLSVHSSLDRCLDVLSSVMSSRLLPRPSLCPALYPTCLYLASFLVVKAIKAGKNQFRLSPRKKGKDSLIIQSKASISHTHTHMHTHTRSSNLLPLAVSTTSHLINNVGNGSLPSLPGRLQW